MLPPLKAALGTSRYQKEKKSPNPCVALINPTLTFEGEGTAGHKADRQGGGGQRVTTLQRHFRGSNEFAGCARMKVTLAV